VNDDYEFSDGVLERAFELAREYLKLAKQEGEFTTSDMAARFPDFDRKYWRRKLDRMADDGLLEKRKGKGNENFYRIAEGVDGVEFN